MFFNIINSGLRIGASTATITDPRTRKPLYEVPVASTQDLDDAVKSARLAFSSWKHVPIDQRQKVLLELADKLDEHRCKIHQVLAKETGKSVSILEQHDCMKISDTASGPSCQH